MWAVGVYCVLFVVLHCVNVADGWFEWVDWLFVLLSGDKFADILWDAVCYVFVLCVFRLGADVEEVYDDGPVEGSVDSAECSFVFGSCDDAGTFSEDEKAEGAVFPWEAYDCAWEERFFVRCPESEFVGNFFERQSWCVLLESDDLDGGNNVLYVACLWL